MIEKIIEELNRLLDEKMKLNKSFESDYQGGYQDGIEAGLLQAIELIEETIKKYD